jgi:DNA-binding NarL/FixJ family response regulator
VSALETHRPRPPARVLLALRDHDLARRVERALELDGGFTVCGTASDAPAAVAGAMAAAPHLCVLEADLVGGTVSAIREITARLPETKVVVLTSAPDEMELVSVLRAGGSGYLATDTDAARLPHAFRDVVSGGTAVPRSLLIRLLEEFRDVAPRRRALVASSVGTELTSREWQVLNLLRRGFSTAQIARKLSISTPTVRSHRAAISKKISAEKQTAASSRHREPPAEPRRTASGGRSSA